MVAVGHRQPRKGRRPAGAVPLLSPAPHRRANASDRLFGCLRGVAHFWRALPDRRPTNRGLAELSTEQLRDLGIVTPRGRPGMSFLGDLRD